MASRELGDRPMGMGHIEVELLIHEHAYKPITGEVIAIGRQHIGPTGPETLDILKRYGVNARSKKFEIDTLDTHHEAGQETILDTSFFRSFSDAKYYVADINPYEGADFIFDICGEVPADLVGRFDFIIDGGSLDNVFDPLTMVRNMTKMLKPGGRMFIYAWSNGFPSAYVKITPDWIMDYCSVNEFADCKVYASRNDMPGGDPTLGQSVDLFHYDPLTETPGGLLSQAAFVAVQGYGSTYCLAEKGAETTYDRTAVQQHYRGQDIQPYLDSAKRFHASPRPIFAIPGKKVPDLAPISEMQTVKPVAQFGKPAQHDPEFMILRKLDHLLTAQKLASERIATDRQILEGAGHDRQQRLSKQFYDQMQALSKQVYDLSQQIAGLSRPPEPEPAGESKRTGWFGKR